MKIKTKLNLGVGLLFALILILTAVSTYFIYTINKNTGNILTANYNTLEYSRNMLLALDDSSEKNLDFFEINLKNQLSNITEKGEFEATANVEKNFEILKTDNQNDLLKKSIRKDIFEIMIMNMNAIKQKTLLAENSASTANLWTAIVGTLCFLIAFNLLVNLPNNIADPIKELSVSIKEIANKNYSQRVHFSNKNEFGDLAKSFNTMAKKLEEYSNSSLHKLTFEKKRLETLINNMHDPIIGLDVEGVILFVNNEAIKIIGLKKEEVIGQLTSTLALKNDLLKSLIINDLQSTKAHAMKIYADGKESYFDKEIVNITIQPTAEEKTIDIGNVIILRNVTHFKEIDFAKTNFIATVSHELKTPIAAIKMSLQLLENPQTGEINEEQKLLIDSVKDDSERLLKITGELLEISKSESGNIKLDLQKSNANDIVKYAIDAVKMQAEHKSIKIIFETENNILEVKADAEKTSWVIINFLTNAIKYSGENSDVVVRLKNENNQIIFQVSDKGKGIDSRYQSKVFDKYFQIPGSNKNGTGLGLAISKEFIEAQNGTIGVNSELGLGSTFYFTLNA